MNTQIEKQIHDVEKLNPVRQKIMEFESILSRQPGVSFGDSDLCPLSHSFAPGVYIREIFIPAGTVLTGKIHKHRHGNFLMSGKVKVFTEAGGCEELQGPLSMISEPGTKRVLEVIEDCWWCTIHSNPTNTTDLEELERLIIAKDYEEYEAFALEEKKKLLTLNQNQG